jgi:hypothetical protein
MLFRKLAIPTFLFLLVRSTTGIHSLKYLGESIQKMLLEPMFRVGEKVMFEIHEFNLNLINLISDLREESPEAIVFSKEFYKDGEPKFVSYRFDSFVVKTKFGWNANQWKEFIKLRERTGHLFRYFCGVFEGAFNNSQKP